MKRTLFLDDDPNRTRKFLGHVPHALCASTASGMIDLLRQHGEGSSVFLDHDLGGEVFVDSGREDCGMEVVRWIVANKPELREIVVHSLNGPAAESMVAALHDAGYRAAWVPFIRIPWDMIDAKPAEGGEGVK